MRSRLARPATVDPDRAARERMVDEQLASPWDSRVPVRDPRVLEAMRRVPRERFVPASRQHEAWDDHPLPIGGGQTISQPYMVGRMTELLATRPGDTVLEIGTGSGYQAAVLAELVARVYSIELEPGLSAAARERLRELGYRNVHLRAGDGSGGWPEHGPYDGIVVTAAPLEVPAALPAQLKLGGRLVIPLGPRHGHQVLHLLERRADGTLHDEELMAVSFVPLR